MSKYEKLIEQLNLLISSNLEKGISKLPTESELCRQYQVSRQTVRTALSFLKEEGIVTSRQGSGSYATGLSHDTAKNTIPILISTKQEYIYPALLADMQAVFTAHGYRMQILPTDNNTQTERQYLAKLLDNPPRGLIVEGCKSALPNPNLDLYEKLQSLHTFLLFLHNRYASMPDTACIKDDNYYGGYLLAKHLTSLGHTRIAGIFKIDDLQGPERYLGVATGLRDLGYPMPDSRVGWFSSQELDTLEAKQDTRFLTNFIRDRLSGCSAVVCYNDEIAYWLIKELLYAGIHVPDEMSVVCFDNSYLSELSGIRITSLSHAPHEMGTRAAECMIQGLKGLSVVSLEIPWHLVRRESDGTCQG